MKTSNCRLTLGAASIVNSLVLIVASVLIPSGAHAFGGNTVYVTTLADNTATDGLCSLRELITNANDHAATYPDCAFPAVGLPEAVAFHSSLGATATLTLNSPLPTLTNTVSLTIDGANRITIHASGMPSFFRVLGINSGASLTLNQLTISGGDAYSCTNEPEGGGILNNGTLSISNSTFSGNRAGNHCYFNVNTDGYWGNGGAVYNSAGGNLTISNSLFSGNDAGKSGGAVYNGGTMFVSASSFIDNSGPFWDGAVGGGAIRNTGTLTVINSTFSGNVSKTNGNGGAIYSTGTANLLNNTFSANSALAGAAIYNAGGTLNLYNTILANSTRGGDCIASGGILNTANNLISDAAHACGLSNGVNGNLIGVDPLLTNLVSSPPFFPLKFGSPALDAGYDLICAASPVSNQSQNGAVRPKGAHCDIGSYERDNNMPTVASIVRADPDPSNLTTIHFTVTFSEPVTGVDLTDFAITTSGLIAPYLVGLSGSGATYRMTVNTSGGFGTVRLDLLDNDTIINAASNPLGGPGVGNADFTVGETYTVIIAPGAPAIGAAAAGDGSALVSFTPPFIDGGSVITGYTATSNTGNKSSSGCLASPCLVTGLANNTAYTFSVTATNGAGPSPASAASNSVTPQAGRPIGSISVMPSALIFANQYLDTPSSVQNVTLTNTGPVALTISSVTSTNAEFAVSHNCGGRLEAGLGCNLVVTFTPTLAGTRLGTVTVNMGGGATAGVALSGYGIPRPSCTLTATPATIARGASSLLSASCSPSATVYNWSGGNCAGQTGSSCSASPRRSTTYSVIGSNASGSSAPATTTVTLPAVDLTPILMLLLD